MSLGSNLGDRAGYLRQALRELAEQDGIFLEKTASFYETPPWGNTKQPAFLNTAAAVQTALGPEEFLDVCQQIERTLGRVRHERWGPRTIDVDIVCADGLVWHTSRLTLPHPYSWERAFVLAPLCEIAPELKLDGKTVGELLEACEDKNEIVLWEGDERDGEKNIDRR